MYEYSATVVSVYDGDSATFDIDLGFFMHMHKVKVRLAGINAPEMIKGTLPGIEARNYLRDLLPIGSTVKLFTIQDKQEKYGRWLAYIVNQDGVQVNSTMIAAGHAVSYMANLT